jgi:hypothetical protein
MFSNKCNGWRVTSTIVSAPATPEDDAPIVVNVRLQRATVVKYFSVFIVILMCARAASCPLRQCACTDGRRPRPLAALP